MRTAPNLKAWTEWCDEQGGKLLDGNIDLKQILDGFIIPVDLTTRPPHVLLGLEWPWQIVGGLTAGVSVTYDGHTYQLLDIGFEVDDYGTDGPFLFSLVTPAWRVAYRATFEQQGLTYSPFADDAVVASRPSPVPMHTWINKNKPTLFLDGDRMITAEDRLLAPRTDLAPFNRDRLNAINWDGVDIRVESQGAQRRADSIQAHMSRHLRADQDFDVLLDDDRAGEAADLVGLAIRGTDLRVTLVHCKYSSQSTAGARVSDLYELCGQAIRGAKWRQQGAVPLLHHLDRRAQAAYARTGVSPYEVGTIGDMFRIRESRATIAPAIPHGPRPTRLVRRSRKPRAVATARWCRELRPGRHARHLRRRSLGLRLQPRPIPKSPTSLSETSALCCLTKSGRRSAGLGLMSREHLRRRHCP